MVSSLVGGGGGTALVLGIELLGQMVQDCFAMAAGATFTEYFLEKNIKVLLYVWGNKYEFSGILVIVVSGLACWSVSIGFLFFLF